MTKTFRQIEQEKAKIASSIVKEVEKQEIMIPEFQQMQEILQDPYSFAKDKVKDLAMLASSIYEVGLSTTSLEVKKWAEEELDMTPTEFRNILQQSSTKEDVQINLLKALNTPKEIIDEVSEETYYRKK